MLEVERFGFSANNITYALLGDRVGYWSFFSSSDGWGRIPVWGYLRASHSHVSGIDERRRAFGFCPMSTHLLARPGRITGSGFVDSAGHRAPLPAAYNTYSWLDTDPAYAWELEDQLLVLRPLFWLSFMLDDLLANEETLDGRSVWITSASSKAAIGTAHLLAARGVDLIGLTSAANLDFVTGLGLYSEVHSYDHIPAEAAAPVVVIDLAGSRPLRESVEQRLGRSRTRTLVAGITHRDATAADSDRSGERISFVFVPELMRRRVGELGWAELNHRYCLALHDFAARSRDWLKIEVARGPAELRATYLRTLQNAGRPDRAVVFSPGETT